MPTLKEVKLAAVTGTTPGADNTVTVKGGSAADQALQATAKSAKGTDITGSVVWTLTGPSGYKNVMFDNTGKVTIRSKATAGDYTLTATPKNGAAQGEAMSVTFKIAREAARAASIDISGGVSTITLPGKLFNAETNTFSDTPVNEYYENTAFTATVKDQYGDPFTADVEWTFKDVDTGVRYRGADHKVCDASAADAVKYTFVNGSGDAAGLEISEDGHLLVTSACRTGSVEILAKVGGIASSASVAVVKADAEAKSVTIDTAPTTATVPADGAISNNYNLSATVKDQYGETMTDKSVTWSLVDENGDAVSIYGMGINSSGRFFVSNSVKSVITDTTGKTYYLKATCDGVSSTTKALTVKRAASVATALEVYRDSTKLTGDTDTVTIPASGTASYGYYALLLDQYGTSMSASLDWSATCAGGASFNIVTLTVTSEAANDATCTVTVSDSLSSLSKTITVTLKSIEITPPTVTVKTAPAYGDTWADIVTVGTDGSAKLNGTNVPGSFYLKTTGAPNAGAQQSYEVWFKSADGQYDMTAVSGKVDIAKATLTVTAKSHSITYGGDPANNGVTYGGFVNGDNADKLGGTLGYDYTYTRGDGVGNSYTITPKGLTSDNYSFTYLPGTLTVTAKALTADMVQDITAVTYNGKTQPPAVTVKDNGTALTAADYTVTYSDNTNATTTAKATITGKGNYSGTVTKNFTIDKAGIWHKSVGIAKKVYDGTTAGTVTKVEFTGLVQGESLTLGTDFTATATYSRATAGDTVPVTVKLTLCDTPTANNYKLTSSQWTITAKIHKATIAMTLTAADAAYTGAAYAGTLTPTVTNTQSSTTVNVKPTYVYYTDADCTVKTTAANSGAASEGAAPKNAGTYYVKGTVTEGTNTTAADAKASFTISKAALTVTANSKTITYGDAPTNNGVTCTGFMGSENESVLGGTADYDYSYTRYGDVGEYTITPKGLTSDNYNFTYVPGTLTVEQKQVKLSWPAEYTFWYDKTAKTYTASIADGSLVNGDEVNVTTVGGTQTDIGQYTATATALTGAKADNYKLPPMVGSGISSSTPMMYSKREYQIVPALDSVTVDSPNTVSAAIDHEDLKIVLTGYINAGETVMLSAVAAEYGSIAVAADKVTANGVVYTIDRSGVSEKPAGLTIEMAPAEVSSDVGGYTPNVTVTDLTAAAYDAIAAAAKADASITRAVVKLVVKAVSYADGQLSLELTPVVSYFAANGDAVGTADQTVAVNGPVTTTISLPADWAWSSCYARHTLANGSYEYLTLAISGKNATWTQDSFSEVVLLADARQIYVDFEKTDGSVMTKQLIPAAVGTALPTDSKSGHTFSGWSFRFGDTTVEGTYKTLTDALLTALVAARNSSGALSGTATPVFAAESGTTPGGSSGSHSGGGSSSSGKSTVTVSRTVNGSVTVSPKSAAKGETVTITVDPDKGYTLETITVTDKNGKELKLTARKNGKYTFTMPNGKATVKATFMEDNTMLNFFVDVPADAYCYDAVLWAVERGITNGLTDVTFGINNPCTRGQIVTFLWRAAGSPAPKGTAVVPTDVIPGSYCYDAVAWALENGITNGFADGTFGVNSTCTRAQAVTFLFRAMGTTPGISVSFTDVKNGVFYADAVAWAVEHGVTLGVTDTTFAPNNTCTRGQIVTFLYRAYQGK